MILGAQEIQWLLMHYGLPFYRKYARYLTDHHNKLDEVHMEILGKEDLIMYVPEIHRTTINWWANLDVVNSLSDTASTIL